MKKIFASILLILSAAAGWRVCLPARRFHESLALLFVVAAKPAHGLTASSRPCGARPRTGGLILRRSSAYSRASSTSLARQSAWRGESLQGSATMTSAGVLTRTTAGGPDQRTTCVTQHSCDATAAVRCSPSAHARPSRDHPPGRKRVILARRVYVTGLGRRFGCG